MFTIFDIANWFLSKEGMTHKKLQKLCYYAQAWYLALYKSKLIDGDFEAWVHGPVNSSLYHIYKDHGWQTIRKKRQKPILNELVEDFLERIWVTYGDYDGHQLEAFTHEETPWINARRGLGPWENSKNIISVKDMEEYYFDLYSGD